MRTSLKIVAVGLLAGAAYLGFWPGEGPQDTASGDAPGAPRAAAAVEARPSTIIAGLGVVEPNGGTIELASELPGVITVLHVAEGDRVKSGDIVAELGNGELRAKVAQAEAQLAIRRADLQRIENGSRLQDVAQGESRVAELRAGLELAEADLQRAVQLQKNGTVSKRALQAATNVRTVALKQLDAAEEALSLLREGSRAEETLAARAEVALAQEQLAEAEAYVAKSVIRASRDGTVLRLLREAGEAVSTQPATALAEIGDTSRLVVRAQIDEADIADLLVGQRAEIAAPALGGRRLTGRIERISPRIGAKIVNADTADEKRDARVLDVIVALEPGTELPVNLRVDVFIDTGERVAILDETPASAMPDWVIRR
ncbi:HlyD family secretion protein [Aureimonas pseudogalii]|uniref:ABC exporter DevB family membrane fusion protein n=1 Tax=Aureimonas pseudogalii TaxID=1744844 RepID=A0A7W6H332_9HYPH|nr:HlyD family efflux transporter periplasmic adaptor subunit [Aureimonas pseudogalii]MBB3996737.1 ABC exporter DevB family membrane fusion protein [Aureimonas pseudogalii]